MKEFTKKEKQLTRSRTQAAIKSGKIKVLVECEICGGTEDIEAHHPDYSDHMLIKWLCISHHALLHSDSNFEKDLMKFIKEQKMETLPKIIRGTICVYKGSDKKIRVISNLKGKKITTTDRSSIKACLEKMIERICDVNKFN